MTVSVLGRVWGISSILRSRAARALAMIWHSAPGWTIASFVLILINTAVTLAGLFLLKLIVDAVAEGIGSPSSTAAGWSPVLVLIVLAGAIAIVGVLSRALSSMTMEIQALLVTDHMLDRLHEKSISIDYAYFEDSRFHNTLHRAQEEAPYRPTQLLGSVTQVFQNGITTVGVVLLLASVHWLLALVIVLGVLPALLVRLVHARRLDRWQRKRSGTERRANYYGWIIGNPQHAKELRVFGLGSELLRRFRELRTGIRQERLDLVRSRNIADAGSQILGTIVVFGSLAFISFQALQGVLSLGDMVMYFGAVQRGQSLVHGLFSSLGKLYEDNLFLAYVDEFLEMEPRIVPPPAPKPLPSPLMTGLECRAVSFHYPAISRSVLHDIDIRVGPGEVVALVGPNGSGKTTLTKLLCRLYDPDAGSITLDGQDIRTFDPAALRRKFAVVFQDYARYDVTARENIWFGDVGRAPDMKRIRDAACDSGVDGALSRLTNGYDTVLSRIFEEGEELSIGEWQKLALARAFMSDAEILIVDEPTSALDAHAEQEVFEALVRLFKDRSAIVISHRLSTIRLVDRIYFMEQGRIVESGTHDELLRSGGAYARLFTSQAGPYQSELTWPGLIQQGPSI